MLLRPLILVAALAAAAPAFAQQDLTAIRAQGEAERAAQEAQRQQIEAANAQRDLQMRVDALEAQRRAQEVLAPQTIATTPLARQEDLRQQDIEARLAAIERQRAIDLNAQSAATLAPISPFTSPQPAYGTATQDQRQSAADTFAACLTAAARRFDDRISDAGTIAVAINPACAGQFEAWKAVLESGTVGGLRVSLDRAIEAGQQSGAVQAVLQIRQQSRG